MKWVARSVQPPRCGDYPTVLAIQRNLQLTLTGSVGMTYRIEYAHDLASQSWGLLTNLTLAVSPFSIQDPQIANTPQRFYRTLLSRPGE